MNVRIDICVRWTPLVLAVGWGCSGTAPTDLLITAGDGSASSGASDSGAGGGDSGVTSSGSLSGGASSGGYDAGSGFVPSDSGGSDAVTVAVDSGGGDAAPASTCPAPPATEMAGAITAVDAVNAIRSAIGVPCMALVPQLDVSAQDHCDYYAANVNTTCTANAHVEVSGCSGFVAAQFGARETAAGYTGQATSEVMAFSGDAAQAVQTWIDSVWHRTPLLKPWIRDMGYGGTTTPAKCDTIDFGRGATTANTVTAVYPYDGQTGVPTSFDGTREGPTPPAPASGWPSGYPVTLFLRGGTVQSHQISVDGTATPIAHVWIDETNATNGKDQYILYTNTRLTTNTAYRVQIAATQGGTALTFDWKFTTGAK